MKSSDDFEFRVSDSLVVPLRGRLLRLRLLSGNPRASSLAVGKRLRVRAPDGNERDVRILDHSITGGSLSQAGLDAKREVDVIVADQDSTIDGAPIEIGWTAHGPVE
jgi:hypothetical protein